LIDLYKQEKTELQKSYINFSVARYLNNEAPGEEVFVINNFFRDWDINFIHDINHFSSFFYHPDLLMSRPVTPRKAIPQIAKP